MYLTTKFKNYHHAIKGPLVTDASVSEATEKSEEAQVEQDQFQANPNDPEQGL